MSPLDTIPMFICRAFFSVEIALVRMSILRDASRRWNIERVFGNVNIGESSPWTTMAGSTEVEGEDSQSGKRFRCCWKEKGESRVWVSGHRVWHVVDRGFWRMGDDFGAGSRLALSGHGLI